MRLWQKAMSRSLPRSASDIHGTYHARQGGDAHSGRGYQVTGYDLIPEAIHAAREIADARGLSIRYDVIDVTQIPHDGDRFDLIVDSFCINHIVFDEERKAVFESVKARLKPNGYYLVSSAVYELDEDLVCVHKGSGTGLVA